MMDICSSSSVEQGKYKIWSLKGRNYAIDRMQFSPCFSMVALSAKCNVKLFRLDLNGLICDELMSHYSNFEIQDMKWSPNSENILLISREECHFETIHHSSKEFFFSAQEPTIVRLLSVEWMPDSLHLISVSDLNVFSFLHSLVDGRRITLPSICYTDCQPLMAYSHNGKYLAFVHYTTCAYYVSLMSVTSLNILWTRKSELHIVRGLLWSPDSSMLSIWDSQRKVRFLDTIGEMVQSLQYQDSSVSGFWATTFAPRGDLFLATCDNDQAQLILVYSLLTWRLSAVLNQETDVQKLGLRYLTSVENLSKVYPLNGKLSFSMCGNFLASLSANSNVVVWNMNEGCKKCISFKIEKFFGEFQWHPFKPVLAISTDQETLLMWKWHQNGPFHKEAKVSKLSAFLPSADAMLWSENKLFILSYKSPKAIIVIKHRSKEFKKILR